MTKLQINSEKSTDLLFKSFAELAAQGEHLEPMKRLFGDYIFHESLIHFTSERGTGKTMLNLQLCLAISSGWDSFLGESIEKHGNTLLINLELHESVMKRRLFQLSKDSPLKIDQKMYKAFLFTTRAGLVSEIDKIKSFIEKYKPVYITLDNYRMAFIGSDSNSNRDASLAINELLKLKDSHNTTLVITDHTRKNTRSVLTESDLQSGAGAKSDLMDGDLFLRRSSQGENLRILKRSKSRYCGEHKGAKLIRLNPDTLWFELVEENVNEEDHIGERSLMVSEKRNIAEDLREKGKTVEQIASILNVSKSTISRWTS